MIGPRSSTGFPSASMTRPTSAWPTGTDRKSTRLNSSHDQISYAVFCLKKKKQEHVLDAGTIEILNHRISHPTDTVPHLDQNNHRELVLQTLGTPQPHIRVRQHQHSGVV